MSVDLSTTYLGLDLAHPVVPSASPLTGDIDHIHALVEAGAPAIVLPSLFEEQIEHNAMAVHQSLELGANGFAETPTGSFHSSSTSTPGLRTTWHSSVRRRRRSTFR